MDLGAEDLRRPTPTAGRIKTARRPNGAADLSDVLIVDDDPAFAGLLEAELLSHGLSSVRAGDAETAEHLLMDGMKPRALVLDLVLPGMQGEELLAKLGALTGNRFPTIVFTLKNLAPAQIAVLQSARAAAGRQKQAGAIEAALDLILEALGPGLVKD
jgi:DNA-binding NtrC family response regulator